MPSEHLPAPGSGRGRRRSLTSAEPAPDCVTPSGSQKIVIRTETPWWPLRWTRAFHSNPTFLVGELTSSCREADVTREPGHPRGLTLRQRWGAPVSHHQGQCGTTVPTKALGLHYLPRTLSGGQLLRTIAISSLPTARQKGDARPGEVRMLERGGPQGTGAKTDRPDGTDHTGFQVASQPGGGQKRHCPRAAHTFLSGPFPSLMGEAPVRRFSALRVGSQPWTPCLLLPSNVQQGEKEAPGLARVEHILP